VNGMPRATNSVASRRRRKKVLKLTKGYWGQKANFIVLLMKL
jgi:Ribosomal protein L20.